MKATPVPVARIENRILVIRGHKVMIDVDLAEVYGVETRVLNQAVKRNLKRFPTDFMFQLSAEETVHRLCRARGYESEVTALRCKTQGRSITIRSAAGR